jgi:hypothetical protein
MLKMSGALPVEPILINSVKVQAGSQPRCLETDAKGATESEASNDTGGWRFAECNSAIQQVTNLRPILGAFSRFSHSIETSCRRRVAPLKLSIRTDGQHFCRNKESPDIRVVSPLGRTVGLHAG